MIVSLDYDETWTKDPVAWSLVAKALREQGHTVYGITMRYPEEGRSMDQKYLDVCDEVFFTSRQAKFFYCWERGIHIDVWIDDSPHWIMRNSK